MSKEEFKCTQCKITKHKSFFSQRRGQNSAKGIYSYCKDCGNKNSKRSLDNNPEAKKKKILRINSLRAMKRKALKDFIDAYKVSIGCARCSYSEFGTSLQFHHLDPESKDDRVSNMIAGVKSLSEIQKEIDKCIILCGNCHAGVHGNLISKHELTEMALQKLPPLQLTSWSSILCELESTL